MKITQRIGLLAAALLASASTAWAADVTGKWLSEFESPVGHLKYVYDLKADGSKLTGKAHRESPDAKSEVEIKDGKVEGDDVSFVEMLHIQEQDIAIEYKGKIAGDEIKFTRKAGDFGTTEIVARREKVAKPEAVAASGKWRAEFDTQIGRQKYVFAFKAEGNVITGKANAEIGDQKMETVLADGKLNGAEITFVENMDFAGQPVRIDYKGAIDGDTIKFTRKVGDVATEELTATREEVRAGQGMAERLRPHWKELPGKTMRGAIKYFAAPGTKFSLVALTGEGAQPPLLTKWNRMT